MRKYVQIDGVRIGQGYPPYIVAELSGNHNGSIERAKEIISRAKACGVNAVKLQTYTADTITMDCDRSDFMITGGPWDGFKLYDLYKWAETPFEWHTELFSHARDIGITIFSSPFDESAVDLLEELGAPAYKIASFEVIDLPLIEYVAKKGKPMIISTGMANKDEIHEALTVARQAGCQDIVLLHCISSYPAPISDSNILTIPELRNEFEVVTGLSDHSMGTTVSVASVALGASFIEKHFTLSRLEKGPDSDFSLEPRELEELVEHSKLAWEALGKAGYQTKKSEEGNLKFRRSLYFTKDLMKGHQIAKGDIKSIRPGYGLPPKYFGTVIGSKLNSNVKLGDPVTKSCINDQD